MKIKVAASIIASDFSCLEREIKKVEQAGIDILHIDIMDGHFVPNITIGPDVVRCISKITSLPLDVHLMIKKPERFIDDFIKAGSNMLTVHIETISVLGIRRQVSRLKPKGIRWGVSLNPATPLERIKPVLKYVDFVLVMSVNPGFSGQEFIPAVIPKIKKLRSIFEGDISVDGGINDKVAPRLIQAGANILASGSYIFSAKDTRLAIEKLKNMGR
ncbi:MAG: ribulose-phosphate 3-epimerase [Candidatus Omnitrophica bacterium]|nr:ribulose-phosphate 3-epimerase [Candidatus Omnitrophota bacterium]